jgi:hypothetical protein
MAVQMFFTKAFVLFAGSLNLDIVKKVSESRKMTKEVIEKITYDNGVAIQELTGIVKQVSKDLDVPIKDKAEHNKNINRLLKANERLDEHEAGLVILEPLILMLKYKRASILMFVGLYATTISEIREMVFSIWK